MSASLLWFIAGFVLILAEFATPGVILVFIGMGAWVASLAAWLGWVPGTGGQVAVFAVSSLVLLLALRRLFKTWFLGFSSEAGVPGALDEFHGKQVRVLRAIRPGQTGKVEFKGSPWNASAEETFAVGDTARIVGIDGLCLKVARAV